MTHRRILCLTFATLPWLLMAPGQQRPTKPTSKSPEVIRAVTLIAPGTVVEKSAPKGWTHLVLKSQPSLPEDQKKRAGDLASRLATVIFTATTATVEAQGEGDAKRYRLAKLGLGVGVKIDGKDVIVTPDTQARLGADLGLLARQVLSAVHEKQKSCRLVAVGQTLAILDTPAFMPRGKSHAPVIMRYVFLVDSKTGQLDTLVWRIDTDGRGGYDGAVGMIEWLAPNTLVDAELQVDPDEFRIGVPSERAFAVKTIPQGKKHFSLPEGLRTTAGTARLSSEQAGQLTQALRELIRADRAAINPLSISPMTILLLALSTLAAPAEAHEKLNPVYRDLRQTGVDVGASSPIPLPKPLLADGLPSKEQQSIIRKLIAERVDYASFTRNSTVSPEYLKIREVTPAAPRSVTRRLEVIFVAYGDLNIVADKNFLDRVLDLNRKEGKAGPIPAEKLKARGLEIKDPDHESFGQIDFNLLDKVRLNATTHSFWSKNDESIIAAGQLDKRFRGDADYPNEWRPLTKVGDGKFKVGKPAPYDGAGYYVKITRLAQPKDALFVEGHIIFHEPAGWFEGTDILRAELPGLIQKQVRSFRQELIKASK